MSDKLFNGLLDEKAVATILNVSVATLRRWRMLRVGPDFIRVGGHVRYRNSTVEDYVTSCSVKCNEGARSYVTSRVRGR